MRGGYLHTQIIAEEVQRLFLTHGALVKREAAVFDSGVIIGYVDLLVTLEALRVAVEIELTTKRIAHDVVKAGLMHVDELWIVTPTEAAARSIRRKLMDHRFGHCQFHKYSLTLPQANKRVRDYLSINTWPNDEHGKE